MMSLHEAVSEIERHSQDMNLTATQRDTWRDALMLFRGKFQFSTFIRNRETGEVHWSSHVSGPCNIVLPGNYEMFDSLDAAMQKEGADLCGHCFRSKKDSTPAQALSIDLSEPSGGFG